MFFRSLGPGVVRLSQRVLSWFPCPGTDTLCLHQTLIEALSPVRAVQRRLDLILCGLEIMLYPQPVLFKSLAERIPFAS